MKKILGIELGSTRIKSVLIDENGVVLAQGGYEWENKLVDGLWSYDLDEVWSGLQSSYSSLLENYGLPITTLDAIGISAMMHGYLAFDKDENLLVPFRTWRNTNTAKAADELTRELSFNMPMRWSATHFYQAVLNRETHVKDVAFFTTLSGYVHYKLTGEKVLGVGDASGMFPITDNDYDCVMIKKYNALLSKHGVNVDVIDLMPKVKLSGEYAGKLTEQGAKLLDKSGNLNSGIILCPPEGDAGTGMVATNAVKERTGNVSAGTSAFVMAVMEKPLSKVYPEIDVVTTPSGNPVAMVHVNNFTSEINAWSELFCEVINLAGYKVSKSELIGKLFKTSLDSDENAGGLIGYNFLSGEPIVGVNQGKPLFLREPSGDMTLSNFMQMQIYSALAGLSIGMEILEDEGVALDDICGHGGFFKTEFVGANAMSAALNSPITVMKTAGEGGAWGIAVLALFATTKGLKLAEFLDEIFKNSEKVTVVADKKEKKKFSRFKKIYKEYLKLEKIL